jgi:hypothetical protein
MHKPHQPRQRERELKYREHGRPAEHSRQQPRVGRIRDSSAKFGCVRAQGWFPHGQAHSLTSSSTRSTRPPRRSKPAAKLTS